MVDIFSRQQGTDFVPAKLVLDNRTGWQVCRPYTSHCPKIF